MVLIGLEVSISFLNLWLLQRYDGGPSWLLISLTNPVLLCRTEHFELWGMKTWENNNAKILLSQNSTNWELRAFLYQPGPPHAGDLSEEWPWETPSHSWCFLLPVILVLVYCLQCWYTSTPPFAHPHILSLSLIPCFFPLLVYFPSPSFQQLLSLFLRLTSATSPFSWHQHSPY